jgi:hypothetical protein
MLSYLGNCSADSGPRPETLRKYGIHPTHLFMRDHGRTGRLGSDQHDGQGELISSVLPRAFHLYRRRSY